MGLKIKEVFPSNYPSLPEALDWVIRKTAILMGRRHKQPENFVKKEGYYIVEKEGERYVLYTEGTGLWFDHVSQYMSGYFTKPEKIIRKINLYERSD